MLCIGAARLRTVLPVSSGLSLSAAAAPSTSRSSGASSPATAASCTSWGDGASTSLALLARQGLARSPAMHSSVLIAKRAELASHGRALPQPVGTLSFASGADPAHTLQPESEGSELGALTAWQRSGCEPASRSAVRAV